MPNPTKTKKERLAVGKPEVRQYLISDIEHLGGSLTGISKIKYIKKVPTRQKRTGTDGKEYAIFEDRVFEVWIDNPNQENLIGYQLKFTTEIA